MEGDASPGVEALAIRVRLTLTQMGLFVAPLIRSPKSESLYLEAFVEENGRWLAIVRVSQHSPKKRNKRWLYLTPHDNWAAVVIEVAKRAKRAPPAAVFREDERWKSNTGRRRPSRGRGRRTR